MEKKISDVDQHWLQSEPSFYLIADPNPGSQRFHADSDLVRLCRRLKVKFLHENILLDAGNMS
jgi:hypothetical protein